MRQCSIKNCLSTKENKKVSTFKFPDAGTVEFQEWVLATCSHLIEKKKIYFNNYFVCELHFGNDSFVQKIDGQKRAPTRKRLKGGAVPSIFPEPSKMTRRCCIQNCTTSENSAKKVTMYRFPEPDSADFLTWAQSVSNNILPGYFSRKRLQVCGLHFTEESFEQSEITVLRDGQEVTFPRTVKRLKKGAYPTIFPPSGFLSNEQLSGPKPYCVVRGCPGKDSEQIKLFCIPASDVTSWCQILRLSKSELGICSRVCSRHFEKTLIEGNRLINDALPTLNLGYTFFINPPLMSEKGEKSEQIGNRRICCILNCNSRNPPFTLFPFPLDPLRYNHWIKLCLFKPGLKYKKAKLICEKHFYPSMIVRKDGRVRLAKNAVPYKMLIATASSSTTQILGSQNQNTNVEIFEIKMLGNDDAQIENAVDSEIDENMLYPKIELDEANSGTQQTNGSQTEIETFQLGIERSKSSSEPTATDVEEFEIDCFETEIKTEIVESANNAEPTEMIVPDTEEFVKIELEDSDSMPALVTEDLTESHDEDFNLETTAPTNSNDCTNCVKLLKECITNRECCVVLEKELSDIRGKFEAYKVFNENKLLMEQSRIEALQKEKEKILAELEALKKVTKS